MIKQDKLYLDLFEAPLRKSARIQQPSGYAAGTQHTRTAQMPLLRT